ncbi:efflux RND transporter periplasmic adaptor subunit [Aurantimonas endophytica]|nr:efflux RND transporter periplasmic adaptor subunit [Aurantimonas endophytica]
MNPPGLRERPFRSRGTRGSKGPARPIKPTLPRPAGARLSGAARFSRSSVFALLTAFFLAAGCDRDEVEVPAPVRIVRTITVEPPRAAADIAFTGHIEAQDQASLSFRIAGRLAERRVGVGASVREGDIVATLDPENELNALRSAQAALVTAEGALRTADNRLQRQTNLFGRNVSTRADLEAAEQGRTEAQAQVDAAAARVRSAEDVVGFTTLHADAPGVVTRIGAEPGEVVAAGQMVVQLARRDGRDAVFEVPADAMRTLPADARVYVALSTNATVIATGRVREVAPQADPVTRTFQVRVGLSDPPPSFRLGTAVSGTIRGSETAGVVVPSSAVTRRGPDTGVWVVDPETLTVSMRKLTLLGADPAEARIQEGLALGDIVVVAGASLLSEGQVVRLAGMEPQ